VLIHIIQTAILFIKEMDAEFISTCKDIYTVIDFDELTSTNIAITIHPYRFSISKNKTPGSISIFCTYNGYILVSNYTYDINIFNTEIDITCIRPFINDIMVTITEKVTNKIRTLFIRTRFIF
jgi:hypothetical protein